MIQFYNSLTKKKENFVPIKNGKISLYTCGPTVYDNAHIGNYRTFLFEDFLKRTLLAFGYDVFHVMNITDVDDKTIQKANEEKKTLNEITDYYISNFKDDLKTLSILPSDQLPCATNHIDQMIEMIQTLIDKDHAYLTDEGSVYFSIDSYENYGVLSNIDMKQAVRGERVASDEYNLDNPSDFVLWKAHKTEDGDVKWDSPWGPGRPGWHIECSAMSIDYLGPHFDIHCGGVDNKFPHHENEIAQSICATNKPFVNFWMHSEFLTVDGGKMSKSLGNYYCLNDLKKEDLSVEEFRYIVLSPHYRSKVNFSLDKKHEAKKAIQRIMGLKERLEKFDESESVELPCDADHFISALENDLDSPAALAIFFDWIRSTNSKLDNDELLKSDIQKGKNFINYFNSIYGILYEKLDVPSNILKLVNEREKARKNNDWANSDKIREELDKIGWNIKDTPSGPKVTAK